MFEKPDESFKMILEMELDWIMCLPTNKNFIKFFELDSDDSSFGSFVRVFKPPKFTEFEVG